MRIVRSFIAAAFCLLLVLPALAHADCLSPAGEAGFVQYNSANTVIEYCNGTRWVAFPKASGGQQCPGSNLVAHWRMNESSGPAIDYIGALSGASSGTVSWAPAGGKMDGAADFTNGQFSVSPAAAINNVSPMSVCVWLYPDSIPGTFSGILDKSTDGANGWNLYISQGLSAFGFYSNRSDYREGGPVTLGAWQHVCATWTGADTFSSIKLYKNGVEVSSYLQNGNGAGTQNDSSRNLRISQSGSYRYDGRMDDVRIYNSVLSDTDILGIYNSSLGCDILASSCTVADAGQFFYNGDDRVAEWCDGTKWHALGPIDPGGANGNCASPTRPGGYVQFNKNACQLEYCDGFTWRGVGAPDSCACNKGTWANGLAAKWKLDESSGTTAADSVSGNANGTVSNGTWAPTGGRINGGLDFNATTTVVNAGSHTTLDDLGPQSISVWIYPRTHGEGNHGWIVPKPRAWRPTCRPTAGA